MDRLTPLDAANNGQADGYMQLATLNMHDELARYKAAEQDGLIIVRPDCCTCRHRDAWYADEPCFSCYGQDSIGEKGNYYEAVAALEKMKGG